MRSTALAVVLMASSAAAHERLVDTARKMFDPSIEKVKARFACDAGWVESPAPDTGGRKDFTVLECKASHMQMLVQHGRVAAMALDVNVGGTAAESARRAESLDAETREAGCPVVPHRAGAPVVVYRCADDFVLAVANLNGPLVALFGPGAFLVDYFKSLDPATRRYATWPAGSASTRREPRMSCWRGSTGGWRSHATSATWGGRR